MSSEQYASEFSPDSSLVDAISLSPNFGERAAGKALDMIIVHYTGMENSELALKWLCMEKSQVSCHYFIFEDGKINQLVAEEKRAWHAGKSCWQNETDINSRSIGIEIANPGHEFGYVKFPEKQMESVVALVCDICIRQKIPTSNILAHSDIAPLRKQDPGELFDWQLLHRAGIGNWVAACEIRSCDDHALVRGECSLAVKDLQCNLAKLGFEIEVSGEFDDLTEACVVAFQRRYRQYKVDGIADFSTVDTLKRLLKIVT